MWRMQEYVTLLQGLTAHTHPGHPDHTHLSSALGTLLRFRGFIQKVLRASRRRRMFTLTLESVVMFSCLSVEGERRERATDGGDAADDPRLPGTDTPPSVFTFSHSLKVF